MPVTSRGAFNSFLLFVLKEQHPIPQIYTRTVTVPETYFPQWEFYKKIIHNRTLIFWIKTGSDKSI